MNQLRYLGDDFVTLRKSVIVPRSIVTKMNREDAEIGEFEALLLAKGSGPFYCLFANLRTVLTRQPVSHRNVCPPLLSSPAPQIARLNIEH